MHTLVHTHLFNFVAGVKLAESLKTIFVDNWSKFFAVRILFLLLMKLCTLA